ncbi:maleylacetate reductase [Verticiella sediminum]|uniref:Maleylacetate reductase n=1 Tax=Verticiella sediminum TaxID=1247510 RepID=A0A556APJ8_9BURK|nr:maleylacetate reductase [Verticiella sediminum]TSH94818.1 maleylacetate reductase [Verticiella sediminum]
MKAFTYVQRAQRVVFGAGRYTTLAQEAAALGMRRALLVSTPSQAARVEQAVALLGASHVAGVFDGAVMHVPVEVVASARAQLDAAAADGLIALGGGSTVGLAKALALQTGLPILAVPSTYAGSEMTPVYGITRDGVKTTGQSARVLPRTVIYDAELTYGLPAALSVTSAFNAMAHAAEALYAADANPVTSLMAEEGIRALASAIPALARGAATDAAAVQARSDALYGAWLSGATLGAVGMALHHKLCHTLGGSFNLPHAEAHTVILPHALAYNASEAPEAMARIARAIGADDAPLGLYRLAREHGAPTSLRQLGLSESDLDRVCELALRNQYPNPRALQAEALRGLLRRAHAGEPPR